MTVAAMKKTIRSLPERELVQVAKSLIERLDDYLDVKKARALLKKGDFVPWEEVRKELHAKHSYHRATSKKVS